MNILMRTMLAIAESSNKVCNTVLSFVYVSPKYLTVDLEFEGWPDEVKVQVNMFADDYSDSSDDELLHHKKSVNSHKHSVHTDDSDDSNSDSDDEPADLHVGTSLKSNSTATHVCSIDRYSILFT